MISNETGIRLIFGLKVRELRSRKGLSGQELSKRTGLSISYLNEIEKGKKYPKGDKIMALAAALDVSYDNLVSLKVPKKIEPVVELLNSDFLRQLPLDLFGFDPQKLVELISANPERINAFVNTILQIARSYEMASHSFHQAALRSYQEIHNNYFPELEEAARQFKHKFDFGLEGPYQKSDLENVLRQVFGIRIDYERLQGKEALRHLRSYFDPSKKVLSLNAGLSEAQEKFLILRELAFQYLQIGDRPVETPARQDYNFAQLLDNFRASYFAGAFLMDRAAVFQDIRHFVESSQWHDQDVYTILKKYDATPEMLMQRLTNILPRYFGFNDLFFLKLGHLNQRRGYEMIKELHLSRQHSPHGNQLHEHYCRRWISLKIIDELLESKSRETIARMQISSYHQTKHEYLCLSVAFPNSSNADQGVSITIGFHLNKAIRSRLAILQDPKIIHREVYTTCERCPWTDCPDRAVPAWRLQENQRRQDINQALRDLQEG